MFLEPTCSLKNLGDAVLHLSNFFIDHPRDETPWNESYCKLAYRHYYFPLNYIRNQRVIEQGKNVNFFQHLDHTIDWGAGPGTASLALKHNLNLKSQLLIEKSTTALSAFKDIYDQLQNPTTTSVLDLKKVNMDKSRTLLTLSYSLTEMAELPLGWDSFEALMIVEPSTRDDGRKLLHVRQKLIDAGYSIWAPCLHQKQCPLLLHSKTDWCHDRIHVKAPDWFKKLEEFLPFRNKTITTSYLLARKEKPAFNTNNKVRMTGDSLEEKGKTRQLVCRSEDREFLTWMHKEIDPQTIPRGIVIDLPEKITIKSNEIRVNEKVSGSFE